MKQHIAIVGNGPLADSAATEINSAKLVIRFNLPRHTPEAGGTRTDVMFIGNGGNSLRRWLINKSFYSSTHFLNASRIILPRHPDIIQNLHPRRPLKKYLLGRKKHYTQRAISEFSLMGKEVSLLPPIAALECYKKLGLKTKERGMMMPSTGFIGINYILKLYVEDSIKLYGFTWQGWPGHPWDAEFQWLLKCSRVIIS